MQTRLLRPECISALDFDAHVHEYAALKIGAFFSGRKTRILQIRPTPAIASASAESLARRKATFAAASGEISFPSFWGNPLVIISQIRILLIARKPVETYLGFTVNKLASAKGRKGETMAFDFQRTPKSGAENFVVKFILLPVALYNVACLSRSVGTGR